MTASTDSTSIHGRLKQPSKLEKPLCIEPHVRLPAQSDPPYFWGQKKANATGYAELRKLIRDGSVEDYERLIKKGLEILTQAFKTLRDPDASNKVIVNLNLSEDLQDWRESQHRNGRTLPSKGHGLQTASEEVIRILNANDWPAPLLTNGALFGAGFANMLIGAHDPRTLFSNYCTDLSFYFEHSYHKVFPEYEALLDEAINDPHALKTLGGKERRMVARHTIQYVRSKTVLEEKHVSDLSYRTLKLNWHDGMVLTLCDNSIVGMAGELTTRGFDPAGVMHDFIFSGPGTDIIDVGSDLYNSELANTILCTADITDTGIITEQALRRIYDAYAHSCGRMYTERWSEPGVRMSALLYTWHIQNNRHGFLRRALLGFPKIGSAGAGQREADLEEAFDKDFRTTGFSRPLATACSGVDRCDQVQKRVISSREPELVNGLWTLLTDRVLQYITVGTVSEIEEEAIAEELRVGMSVMYSHGLVEDLAWLVAHASHHGWQVNRLFEAAMWGSLLDDGQMKGRLDRKE